MQQHEIDTIIVKKRSKTAGRKRKNLADAREAATANLATASYMQHKLCDM